MYQVRSRGRSTQQGVAQKFSGDPMTVANVRIEEFLDRGNQITQAVAASARICAQILPKYELPPNTKTVISTTVDPNTLAVDDVTTIPLAEIRVRFPLDWQ